MGAHSKAVPRSPGRLHRNGDDPARAALVRRGRCDATDAVERFPAQPGPHIDFARLSETRGNWAEAAARWDAVRERFPDHAAGYISGAGALRELGRLDEAEALLAEAVERFPGDAGLAIGYAAAAHRRRDWEETVRRCESLRTALPLEPIGYTLAGAALRELGRYDEAEPLLASACARFRADIGVATEHALIALAKRDWARAAERWDEVCRRDPNQLGASLHQAVALRELGRYDDAEVLLRQAAAKFPEAAQPLTELARVAEARQDWEEALARWREARTRFPEEAASYVGEAAALRRSGRMEEAEPLLLKAAERLPHDPAPLAEWALIAHERRDWEEALKRWDSVHANFPDHRNAYLFGAMALRELGRLDEAEALLRSALGRFSPDFALQVEHGRIAEARGDMSEAQARWAALKSAFPQYSLGYISEARGLRQLGRFDEAEQLLATAVSLFPDDPGARSEHAWLAQITRDFEQAAERWQEMRSRLPDLPVGYSVGAAALRELGRFDQAEALLADASKRFPQDASVTLERARLAHMRRHWPAAAAHWEVVRAQLPNEIESYASGGIALAEQGRFLDADEVLKEGLARFPSNQRLYAVFADLASMRNDWPEAFSRWTGAQNRFPDARDFGARLFEARLRLYEVDPEGIAALGDSPAEQEGGAADMRDIMMAFESLGHGCEFGSVQREHGSEPLGLLRWGAISPKDLMAALDAGFAGVGAPGNTELTLRPNGERSEYWVADRRFGMEMHTFIGAEQISFERMFEQSCRRMEFLSRKLLDDLEKAEKIFVYKLDHRDLTDGEIWGLHTALRRYGEATLLCVRRENEEKRNGTVDIAGPGLMVAYIDRFAEPQADGRLTVALDSWSDICRTAYQLWKAEPARSTAEGATSASLSEVATS